MTATTHHGTDDDAAAHGDGPRGSRALLVYAGLVIAAAALVGGLLLGHGMADDGPERVTDPVSLGFVRDMSTHHAQAVRMSEIAHRRTAAAPTQTSVTSRSTSSTPSRARSGS